MDHGGQSEREGTVMSHGQRGGVDLCDNLPDPNTLTAQNRNLNETLTQTQSHTLSQNEERGECKLIQKNSVNDNGGEEEEEENDEVMKEEEEEEESEESSSLIRCQSPDDSSYSETGSLLETPYPFSPGTSPEPTSPIIPVVSPETTYPISPVELNQCNAEVDSHKCNTGSTTSTTGPITCMSGATCTTEPIDCTLTITSGTRPTSTTGPVCVTEATATIAKTINSATEPLTSSSEPIFTHGPTCTEGAVCAYAEPITATTGASTSTATDCTTRLTTSIAGLMSSTPEPITFTTGAVTFITQPITSTTVPTSISVPTCATRPISSPALLASLEHLSQRGDDTRLPEHLHQIAEAFVLHEDYQRALWCIQLERLYHQRILDNLNALQEHWESRCSRTSDSDLASQQLDTLTHICQTHSRPCARDAVCASLDLLRPSTFEEETLGGALSSCTSGHLAEGRMEQRAGDSTPSQNSQPITFSTILTDTLQSPENSEKGRADPDRELEGRASFFGNQLTDEVSGKEVGEVEGGMDYTTLVSGTGIHPPTTGEMDRSKPAALQGGEVEQGTQEKEVKKEEEKEVEEAAEALEMEEEGEEEETQEERDSPVCLTALPEEILVSEAEVEVQQLHQEALTEEELHEETQLCQETQEANLPQEADMKQCEEEEGGEEEEEYGVERVDIIREAASLDDLAKLITVEEMSPASGLVSILKKRSVRVDNVCVSASSEPQPYKLPAKRRVRFKVPDDSYEHDIGGGDSCLLLFLLCLVTVVISVGGTALYCALGDAHSSVCQDFSRNADFYIAQMQRGIAQIQHWFTPGS